jgi:putative ABC transport system ATP-binding protein
MSGEVLVQARDLVKVYRRGTEEVRAVDGVSLEIRRGEMVSFVGPSGSGKTTLLHLLGALDNPTSGTLRVDGEDVFGPGRSPAEGPLTRLRRRLFGYVFQYFYLVPTLTVRENVALPLMFGGRRALEKDVDRWIERLGMSGRKDHRPGQLSGGEMQRTAIARALVGGPKVLLADEPTGNLDSARTEEIKEIFRTLHREEGLTLVMVTHNRELAAVASRVISLRDGKIA